MQKLKDQIMVLVLLDVLYAIHQLIIMLATHTFIFTSLKFLTISKLETTQISAWRFTYRYNELRKIYRALQLAWIFCRLVWSNLRSMKLTVYRGNEVSLRLNCEVIITTLPLLSLPAFRFP